jgi:hypothetical protein
VPNQTDESHQPRQAPSPKRGSQQHRIISKSREQISVLSEALKESIAETVLGGLKLTDQVYELSLEGIRCKERPDCRELKDRRDDISFNECNVDDDRTDEDKRWRNLSQMDDARDRFNDPEYAARKRRAGHQPEQFFGVAVGPARGKLEYVHPKSLWIARVSSMVR